MIRRPPRSTLFPYTTLFRSVTRDFRPKAIYPYHYRNQDNTLADLAGFKAQVGTDLGIDRKSTRLNSSHTVISYAVFCLKKKNSVSSIAVLSITASIMCTHVV